MARSDPEKYPTRIGKRWEEDEVKKLLTNIQLGKSHSEIAKEHERTPGSIRARLKVLAYDYHMEGRSFEEIYKYTGMTQKDVLDVIAKQQSKAIIKDRTENESEQMASPPSELKEVLIILKDIQSMMHEFLERATPAAAQPKKVIIKVKSAQKPSTESAESRSYHP